MHNIFHYLLCSFGDCYTCFTLTRRVFSLLWWSGKVSSFFWTEHKRLVPSFHSSQGTQIICSTTALPWIPVNEQPGIVVGQSPRAWWCGGTGSMAPPALRPCSFGRSPLLGTEAAEVPMGILLLSSNTCTKPRESCFLWEGEALPRVIKQPERSHSTHKNAKFSLSSAPQNTEATGDLPGVFSAVAQRGLTWSPAENVLANRQITFLKRIH